MQNVLIPRHLCRLSLLALFRLQHQLDQPKTETGEVRNEQRTKGGLSRDGEMKDQRKKLR